MSRLGGIDRRSLALATAAAAALALGQPPAVTADEPVPQVLPGSVIGTVVADLDGDGVDDVVRLIRDPQSELVVDAWGLDRAEWRPIDARRVPPRDRDSLDGAIVRPGEPEVSGLMRSRHEGRDEVLLVTGRFDRESPFGQLCCVAAWRVRLVNDRLHLEATEIGGALEAIYPIDLDGDGTDELLTTMTRYESVEDSGTTIIEILVSDGPAWTPIWSEELDPPGYAVLTGDSDGRPGGDVILRREPPGELTRISVRDGEIVEEHASLTGLVGRDPWPTAIVNGDLLVVASDGVHLVRWPADEAPSVVAQARMSSFPSVQVVGHGADALLVLHGPDLPHGRVEPRVDVYDLSLARLGSVTFEAEVLTAWRRDMFGGLWTDSGRPLFPHVGPIPGYDGYAAGGTLVRPDGEGGYVTAPMASLIGTPIAGIAGDGEWAVLGNGHGPAGGPLYLYGGFPGEASGRTALVPLDQLLDHRAELAGTVALRDAVELGSDAGRTTVVADGDGFSLIVTALPGTAVAVFETVTRVYEVGDEPLEIPVRPHRSGDEDLPFERELLVMSSTGHASLIRLEGTFIRNPPELSALARTELFAARATVSGRASPGATVSVDGRSVEATGSGRFELDVDAPIWPRTIVVSARDPLGNETTQRLEVIGVVDYRGLPWLAIAAAVTVAAGVAMFLRTPRRRPLDLLPDGDGRLEEIDGDHA